MSDDVTSAETQTVTDAPSQTAPAPAAQQPAADATKAPDAAPRGKVSAIEAAFEKASGRLAAKVAERSSESKQQADSPAEHAAQSGASTPDAGESGSAAVPEPEVPSGPEDASRATVPDNLPEGMRSFLQGLPPEQRQHHLDHLSQVTKGVQAFLQRHAEQRKAQGSLDDALAVAGFSHEQVADFVRGLQNDPAATLRALSEHYQVELDAELKRPEHFESIAEYDEWRDKKEQRRLERYIRQREQADFQARKAAEYESEHARLAKSPGYDRARIDAMVRDSSGFLTPEQAYNLTQVDALRREVLSLRSAKAEAEKLRQEAEQRQKAALAPVNGAGTGRRKPGAGLPVTSAAAGALERVMSRRGMV